MHFNVIAYQDGPAPCVIRRSVPLGKGNGINLDRCVHYKVRGGIGSEKEVRVCESSFNFLYEPALMMKMSIWFVQFSWGMHV